MTAHELAHARNGDAGRGLVVGSAVGGLGALYAFLSPRGGVVSDEVGVVDSVVNGLFWVLRLPAHAVLSLELHLLLRDSRRAEYYADALAARVAGTDAVVSLHETLLLTPLVDGVTRRHAIAERDSASIFDEIARVVRVVPERERERRRRAARLEDARLDVTHPPTGLRIALLEERPPAAPRVVLAATDAAAVGLELEPFRQSLAAQLLESHRDPPPWPTARARRPAFGRNLRKRLLGSPTPSSHHLPRLPRHPRCPAFGSLGAPGRTRDQTLLERPAAARWAVAAGLLAVVLPGAVAAAWPTNEAELDPGICGLNLQIGSNTAASSTAKPTFLLWGDGGLSSYTISIDGNPIGTFISTGRGHVCIAVPSPLADGAHALTGTELAPHAGSPVIPFYFTVDTVLPPSPSRPVLSGYTDSGLEGDGVTRFRQLNFTGSAGSNLAVQLLAGTAGLGGTRAEASGAWSATTVNVPDGTYDMTAITLDSAGNRSARSPATTVTVDTVAPATPDRPSLDDTADGPILAIRGTVAADVARIVVFGDGAQIGTATPDAAHNWRFTLPTLDAGPHALSVAAADTADNVTNPSPALSVNFNAISLPPRRPASSAASASAPASASSASAGGRSAGSGPAAGAGSGSVAAGSSAFARAACGRAEADDPGCAAARGAAASATASQARGLVSRHGRAAWRLGAGACARVSPRL